MQTAAINDGFRAQIEQSATAHTSRPDREIRLQALQLAVSAHNAGDCKKDVAGKAEAFLAFLWTGEFPKP